MEEILPQELRQVCRLGTCDPSYLENKEPVFCHIPNELGGPRWSAKPSEVLPSVASIIVLIHFTPIALDYSVHYIALFVAATLWERLKIRTHVLDEFGRPDRKNLIGLENSFLRSTAYDAMKRMILLKDLAYYAGLGQYGRNSLIINRDFGSDFKIQALFTEFELKYDVPIEPKAYPACKDCCICVENCPAKAIHDYAVVSERDVCSKSVVKDRPIIIGKLPKGDGTWENASLEQKIECRICQSFCPANSRHYVKSGLVLARRDQTGKIEVFRARL